MNGLDSPGVFGRPLAGCSSGACRCGATKGGFFWRFARVGAVWPRQWPNSDHGLTISEFQDSSNLKFLFLSDNLIEVTWPSWVTEQGSDMLTRELKVVICVRIRWTEFQGRGHKPTDNPRCLLSVNHHLGVWYHLPLETLL